jgi:putative peptide zinc metalloprotease protein
MSSPAAMPRSASQRPVPFQARRDLSAQQVQFGDQWYWVLKDPLRNELFRLRADQYAIHQLLDGRRSLDEIRAELAQEFRDLSVTLAQLQDQVFDLFRKGLLWSTRPGQAEPLARRQLASRRRRLLSALQNPLFIRLPGWDPQRLLDRFYPAVKGLLHPVVLLATSLFVAATWAFVLVRFDEFRQRLPELHEVLQSDSLLLMWTVIAAVKVLHELGHAFACKRFGGECHEIGVALMIFSPSLYCDVTDAGRLPSRWARMAIGAAGMFVELVLSAAAFALWWSTHDGLLHEVCFTVFVVTQVSVVAFNLNPLLRLDGYYMLCDWLGVPNLRQKADRLVGRFLCRWALDVDLPDDASLPTSRRWLLAAYAVASALFRWQMVIVISLLLYKALEPYGLQLVGLLLGLIAVAASVSRGVGLAWRTWRDHHESVRRPCRPRITFGLVAAGGVAVFAAPFPVVVTAPLIVEPVHAQSVYVTIPGRLAAVYVRPGQSVKRGDLLAELSNRELADDYRELHTSYEVQCVAVTVHQALGETAQTAVALELRDALFEESEDRADGLTRLRLTAPCAGVVISPPPQPNRRRRSDALSSELTGTPLDPANAGVFLPVGTQMLTVAPIGAFQAVLLVDQFSQEDFAPGQSVRIKLDDDPGCVIHGVIQSQSALNDQYLLPTDGFSTEKLAAARTSARSKTHRMSQATVRLDQTTAPMVAGLRGEARRIVFRSSLAAWLWRQARLTFNFL